MKLDLLLPKWASMLEERARQWRAKLSTESRTPTARRLRLRQLEERVMMSAAPLADGAEANLEPEQDSLGEAVTPEVQHAEIIDFNAVNSSDAEAGSLASFDTARELVFIDPSASDYDELIADLLGDQDPDRTFDIFVLDSQHSGVEQISEVLSHYSDVSALHLISHGQNGSIKLGNEWLNQESLVGHAGQLSGWGNAFASDADLLIYGCNLASDVDGAELVDSISALTGTDVAASDDITGHQTLSGDWDLEYTTGEIETSIAFSETLQSTWNHVLMTGWSISGTTSVVEGGTSSYTIELNDTITTSASIDLALTDVTTGSTDYNSFVDAVNAAISSRGDLSFNGTTLTFAPTSGYNVSYNPTGGGFVDISGTGTSLGIGDESNTAASIGFAFDLYGTSHTQAFVSDNGYLTFGSGTNQWNNQDMSSGTTLGGRAAIAVFWDDMNPTAAGDVFAQTTGTAGNREFIVQWNNVPFYGGGSTETGTYQVVLSEATGEIEFRYQDLDFQGTSHDNGLSATIGIQDGTGQATQHAFNTNDSVVSGSTLTFSTSNGNFAPLTIELGTVNDMTVESTESYQVSLSNAIGTALTTMNSVTTSITDDDIPPSATDNLNSVSEDGTLVASGNLISDDDGFGVDFVDTTLGTTTLNWASLFADGETLSSRTVNGTTVNFSYIDTDGISGTESFTAQSIGTSGGTSSFARFAIDSPSGLGSSRIQFTTTFSDAVDNFEFSFLDFDDGAPQLGR